MPSIIIPESAGILPVDDKYVYLLERNPNYINNDKRRHEWEYPGGKVENKETYQQCAIREAHEETANIWKINDEQFIDEYSVLSISPKGQGVKLYIIKLDTIQLNQIDIINEKLKEKNNENTNLCESLSMKKIPLEILQKYISEEITDIEGLQLRGFNKIVIKKFFDHLNERQTSLFMHFA